MELVFFGRSGLSILENTMCAQSQHIGRQHRPQARSIVNVDVGNATWLIEIIGAVGSSLRRVLGTSKSRRVLREVTLGIAVSVLERAR